MTRSCLDTIEDIKDVMAATGCSEAEAIAALLDHGSVDDATAAVRSDQATVRGA